MLRSPRRLLMAAAGVLCVGLALAGVILPGLPTTVFLIAASFFFTRSCPWLEQRLIRNRVFRPYLPYLDGSRPMPRRARLLAIGMMWAAVAISVATVGFDRPRASIFAGGIVVAAVVGTIVVATIRRGPQAERTGAD